MNRHNSASTTAAEQDGDGTWQQRQWWQSGSVWHPPIEVDSKSGGLRSIDQENNDCPAAAWATDGKVLLSGQFVRPAEE